MESKKNKLTQARLKELMDYDPTTGVFIRKVSISNAQKGSRAGNSHSEGYLACKIDGKGYFCHRLAWLFVHGYFPEHDIDHINRVRADNRIENLREASRQCNIRNSKQKAGTSSGVKGVTWDKDNEKWHASISVGWRGYNLGRYKSKHNAVCARLAAEQCLGWAGCDSNSPAYQYVQKMVKEKT